MKLIPISVDAVPENKRTHPDYLRLLADMTRGMADSAKVLSVCTHEAGHFFFAVELKMEILGLEGPQIIYIPPDHFQGHAAKVKIKVISNTVEQIAIMLSAGGVFSLEIDSALGAGDADDYDLFKTTCKEANVSDPKLILSVWEDGQKIVRARVQDPVFKEGMKELARRLMQNLEDMF